DQTIGGLTMWIPAALVEVVGLLVALGTLMRLSAKGRLRRVDRLARQSPGPARGGV
ncbi:cytochrome c oxidase assembly protein, partial [Bordetella hinzii]|nr:cytochrome c oxidase assembly protein [Bordetella hinzii]